MDRIEEIEKELKKILTNFNKSINRQYSNKTLQEKKETVEKALAESKDIVETPADAKTVVEFVERYQRIRQIADSILELVKAQSNSTKMAFDIKTATALVQTYNGNLDETESFIESMELLDELTPAEQKSIMIKFIKTRISGQAKYAITNEITSVDQIKAKLRQKFTARVSSEAILAQLKNCRQGSRKLTDYSNQMENLTRQLTRAYIHEAIATGEAAEKLAEKTAVQAFAKNISNPETSLILRAGNFATVSEAATKALTVDEPETNKILHFNSRQRGMPRNSWNRNATGNNRRGGYQQNAQQRQNQRYPNNRNNNNAFRNYNNNYNRHNNNTYNENQLQRGNNRQGGPPNRRINYCEAGEYEDPQPNTDAVRLGVSQ